ncbi:MAG: sec-independent protein translocase protein TatB [Actinomycetota bacterium]|nr:sec-independent protein translocase protein TatB [Actinomycetota bacterium]
MPTRPLAWEPDIGGKAVPFDLSMWKLMVLGIIALVVFGPDKLPQYARDAGRMLRQLRGMAQAARTELKSELGDTLGDFDIADLNPRAFVRKHLLDDLDTDLAAPPAEPAGSAGSARSTAAAGAAAGQAAPFDADAT